MLDELTSGEWWLSVVIVGLAINLASAYAKTYVDSLVSWIWALVRSKSAHVSSNWKSRVESIRQSDRALIMECSRGERHQSQSVHALATIAASGVVLLVLAHSGLAIHRSAMFVLYTFWGYFILEGLRHHLLALLSRLAVEAAALDRP